VAEGIPLAVKQTKIKEEKTVKTLIVALAVAVSVTGLAVTDALAFSCPALQKAASDSIARAEESAGKIADAQAKGRVLAMVAVAKDLVKASEESHKKAADTKDAKLHFQSEAQAKAAKALAEMAK
jgi:hypothetical protein